MEIVVDLTVIRDFYLTNITELQLNGFFDDPVAVCFLYEKRKHVMTTYPFDHDYDSDDTTLLLNRPLVSGNLLDFTNYTHAYALT